MKIFGHPWIESEAFVEIDSLLEIKQTMPASILLFNDMKRSIELLHYCQRETLPTAVRIDEIKHAIFANLLNVQYIIVSSKNAREIQALAQHYLFDTEVVVEVESEDEIERYAKMGIDAVIFPTAILPLKNQ